MINGTWTMLGGITYIVVNSRGTLEKLGRAPWYRILALFFLNVFGKCTTIAEVRAFLKAKPSDKARKSKQRGRWLRYRR